jgi:hypothetical protein
MTRSINWAWVLMGLVAFFIAALFYGAATVRFGLGGQP